MGGKGPTQARVSEFSLQLPASPAWVGLANGCNTSGLRVLTASAMAVLPLHSWQLLRGAGALLGLKALTYCASSRIWFYSRSHFAAAMT